MVEEIWRQVAAKRALRAQSHIQELSPLPKLEHDLERHAINARCVLDRQIPGLPSARPFPRLKQTIKRRAAEFTMAVMKRHFDDEQEFRAHLVQFQNNIAGAHDQVSREIAALHRGTLLECERLMSRLDALEQRLEQIQPPNKHFGPQPDPQPALDS